MPAAQSLMMLPDIEKVLIAAVAADPGVLAYSGIKVAAELHAPLKRPQVVITKGPSEEIRAGFAERAAVTVWCYSADRQNTSNLARAVKLAIERCAGFQLQDAVVTSVKTLVAPYWEPDESHERPAPRFTAVYDVVYHATASSGAVAPPQGGGGAGTTSSDTPYVAAVDISGHRAVTLNSAGQVIYFDPTNAAHRPLFAALSTSAALATTTLTVVRYGLVTEPSWAWTPGALIYATAAGVLSQTAPSAPSFLKVMGNAITATSMWVDPQPPITLV